MTFVSGLPRWGGSQIDLLSLETVLLFETEWTLHHEKFYSLNFLIHVSLRSPSLVKFAESGDVWEVVLPTLTSSSHTSHLRFEVCVSVSVGVRTRRHVCIRRGTKTDRALEIENAVPIYRRSEIDYGTWMSTIHYLDKPFKKALNFEKNRQLTMYSTLHYKRVYNKAVINEF